MSEKPWLQTVSTFRTKIVSFFYMTVKTILTNIPFLKISANRVTAYALVIGIISAFFFGIGNTLWGGIFLILSGFMDAIDGSIARLSNTQSKFGAQLDSTLDRYTEFIIFGGLLYYYQNSYMFFIVFLALVGSIMVSYGRARAQALGVDRVVGVMQRPERLILLAAGAIINWFLAGDTVMNITLIVLAISSNLTAVQRILVVKQDQE